MSDILEEKRAEINEEILEFLSRTGRDVDLIKNVNDMLKRSRKDFPFKATELCKDYIISQGSNPIGLQPNKVATAILPKLKELVKENVQKKVNEMMHELCVQYRNGELQEEEQEENTPAE